MPVLTITSAISLRSFSFTRSAKLFQLIQPIGGTDAGPEFWDNANRVQKNKNRKTGYFFIFSIEFGIMSIEM